MADGIFWSDASDWRKSLIDGGAPYSVWTPDRGPCVGKWYCVCDQNGVNVMTRGTGQVFTDQTTANRLCEEWNG